MRFFFVLLLSLANSRKIAILIVLCGILAHTHNALALDLYLYLSFEWHLLSDWSLILSLFCLPLRSMRFDNSTLKLNSDKQNHNARHTIHVNHTEFPFLFNTNFSNIFRCAIENRREKNETDDVLMSARVHYLMECRMTMQVGWADYYYYWALPSNAVDT